MRPSRAPRLSLLLASSALVLVATACGQESETAGPATHPVTPDPSSGTLAPPALTGTDVHWGYGGDIGPAAWGGLSPDYTACETGDAQSPIDLASDESRGEEHLELAYGEIDDHVLDNGHSIQLVNDTDRDDTEDADAPDHLEIDGAGDLADAEYTLAQFHFHAPSEHTVDGRHFPVEFHFVHTDAEGHTAVLGVFARQTPDGRDNPAWAPFVAAASTPEEQEVPGHLDVAALLPDDLEHWAYDGSLTTPPCSEGVHWMVLDHPVGLGADQVAALDAAYVDNNRPIQERGARPVVLAD